jgi:hypothetical protein
MSLADAHHLCNAVPESRAHASCRLGLDVFLQLRMIIFSLRFSHPLRCWLSWANFLHEVADELFAVSSFFSSACSHYGCTAFSYCVGFFSQLRMAGLLRCFAAMVARHNRSHRCCGSTFSRNRGCPCKWMASEHRYIMMFSFTIARS